MYYAWNEYNVDHEGNGSTFWQSKEEDCLYTLILSKFRLWRAIRQLMDKHCKLLNKYV